MLLLIALGLLLVAGGFVVMSIFSHAFLSSLRRDKPLAFIIASAGGLVVIFGTGLLRFLTYL